jgi:hypothetical protein
VGVIAASSTKTVTVCANKKTNVLRYAKNGKCVKKKETRVLLNQTGATGATGAPGTNGTNGTNGAKGDTGPAGSSSPTGFTARSVCGSDGTTLCAVGVQGPGGGTIFYVDSTNEIPGYDYLEAAPADATFASSATTGVWATTVAKCGTAANANCQASYITDAGSALKYLALGTGRAATAEIVARHKAGSVAQNLYAAGVADGYTTATASDWFLPSVDELNELCKYARNTGQAVGATILCAGGTLRTGFASGRYWSSSEDVSTLAWLLFFNDGSRGNFNKANSYYVRPVRAF